MARKKGHKKGRSHKKLPPRGKNGRFRKRR